MLKRIIATSAPAMICSAISGVQAGEQIVPVKDLWELNGMHRPEYSRIREEALAREREIDGMQEIATGLEVSIDANKNNQYRIALRNESNKKIAEAHGTAEEVELLKAMKSNEERAIVMEMKELIERGEKPGFAGWKARMIYAIKDSKFMQGLGRFWALHGDKVKKALKITGVAALAALAAYGAVYAVGTGTPWGLKITRSPSPFWNTR